MGYGTLVVLLGLGACAVGIARLRQEYADLLRRLKTTSQALEKSEADRRELVASLAALDDELTDAENLIYEAVVFCDECYSPVSAGSRYHTTYVWPEVGKPKPVVVCGRCVDDQTDTLTFSAIEA